MLIPNDEMLRCYHGMNIGTMQSQQCILGPVSAGPIRPGPDGVPTADLFEYCVVSDRDIGAVCCCSLDIVSR